MRYDLAKIMKAAHNLRKSGKYTMSEALKKSWKMEKFNVWMKEQRTSLDEQNRINAAKEAEITSKAKAEAAKMAEERKQREAKKAEALKKEREQEARAAKELGLTYEEYQSRISRAMGYGVGAYCGD